jgi:hypothetical protein
VTLDRINPDDIEATADYERTEPGDRADQIANGSGKAAIGVYEHNRLADESINTEHTAKRPRLEEDWVSLILLPNEERVN